MNKSVRSIPRLKTTARILPQEAFGEYDILRAIFYRILREDDPGVLGHPVETDRFWDRKRGTAS